MDRTAAFRVLVGWFRLVCSNGLFARTGEDPRFAPGGAPRGRSLPDIIATVPVPGSQPPADTAYKVTQILAWPASRTGELGERMARRAQIGRLMAGLGQSA